MYRQQEMKQQHPPPPLVPPIMLSDYGVAEITWENGQPTMHGLVSADETLESIVHQATTYYNQTPNQVNDLPQNEIRPKAPKNNLGGANNIASSSAKWGNSASQSYLKKRPRPSVIVHDQFFGNLQVEDNVSNSATINSKENDTTMMTWPSSDSPNQSFKSQKTDDDSAGLYGSENQEEECRNNEGETVRSHSSRRSRAAAVHNQSERRRRERINQKMKALQKLVPNANKTDKASMLDEVIDYLKKLQSQVQLMKNMPFPPQQMMMPIPLQLQQQQQQQQQQQLQMSMLARMGMGFGLQMGMPGIMPQPAHHPFMAPQTMINPGHVGATSQTIHSRPSTNTTPFSDPHSAFLAQHMNMDMFNNMPAFYRQQANQGKSMGMDSSQPEHVHGK